MYNNIIQGDRFQGVRNYDWFREKRRQDQQSIRGTQIAVTPDSANATICGRLLDSSVLVGGFGGLPIASGSVGISALGGTAEPAPTWDAGTVTATPSATALSTDVVIQATLNNVPQDGNCNRLLWVFRRNGTSTWTPWAETPLSGLPNPPAHQVQSFGFGNLVSGLSYDFGVAYVTVSGLYGAIAILENNYAVPAVSIPSSYMLGGTAVTPTFSGVSDNIGTSVNGISTPLTLNWTCTNQPTDGSLSRVSVWIRQNGTTNWTYYASLQAVGVNLLAPPASGAYTFTFTDLTNGISYDFGLSYENAQGGEGNVAVIASNIAMPNVGPPATAKMPSAILSSGPHISSATYGSFSGYGTAHPVLPVAIVFSDWTVNNAPAWLLGARMYVRIHGSTNPQPVGDVTIGQAVQINTNIGCTAAQTIDIGVSYVDNAAEESAIAWPGSLSAIVVPAIGATGIGDLGQGNLIVDSSFLQANSAGSNDPCWSFEWIDGQSFKIDNVDIGGAAIKKLHVFSGDNARNCQALSEAISVQPGVTYYLSAYFYMRAYTGNAPYWAVVGTNWNIGTAAGTTYVQLTPAGTNNQWIQVSTQWTCPNGVSQVCVLFNSNKCAISNSGSFSTCAPMLSTAGGPYVAGPTHRQAIAAAPPTTDANSTTGGPANVTDLPGTAYHGSQSAGVQSAIDPAGNQLNLEFVGGKEQADGSWTNVDGVTSATKYTLNNGQPFHSSVDLAKGVTTNNSGIILGNLTNGYVILFDGNGKVYLGKYVNGAFSALTSLTANGLPNDTNYHSFRLTVTPGSSNLIEGSVDSIYLTATDSSLVV